MVFGASGRDDHGVLVIKPRERETSTVMRKSSGWRCSNIPDVLQSGAAVQVLPDGVVVDGGCQRHEHVPDGVSERNYAIRFEEDDTQAVDEASERQLVQPVCVTLFKTRTKHMKIIQ